MVVVLLALPYCRIAHNPPPVWVHILLLIRKLNKEVHHFLKILHLAYVLVRNIHRY